MKMFRSSSLRPFGSLAHGIAVTALILAAWLGFSMLLCRAHGLDGKQAVREPARQAVILIPSTVILGLGMLCTLCAFGSSRGRYQAGPTDLVLRHGWLWQKTQHLPYEAISEITITRGPLMNLLGTADLKIAREDGSAGVALYGVADAEDLRRFLLERRDSLREAAREGLSSGEVVVERLTRVLDRLEKKLPAGG